MKRTLDTTKFQKIMVVLRNSNTTDEWMDRNALSDDDGCLASDRNEQQLWWWCGSREAYRYELRINIS